MNKGLVIFDLDGVLVDAKIVHYDTLNQALEEIDPQYTISYDHHLLKYDGLNTRTKLHKLTEHKGLDHSLHDEVYNRKQELTVIAFSKLGPDKDLISIMKQLREDGYLLACCTNSIRRTAYVVLSRLGVIEYLDLVLSNQDVESPKPFPEIYWKAMSILKMSPSKTLIVEDSPPGLKAAYESSAKVLRVSSRQDLSLSKIKKALKVSSNSKTIWHMKNLTVLIPMAGAGKRFSDAGYTFPKPLIEVNNKPMIQLVVENLGIKANYVFIVQKEHNEKYNLNAILNMIAPGCTIIETDGLTEGAACTSLLAEHHLDNDNPLLIANSDQYVVWDSASEFIYKALESKVHGSILTHTATHPKWSFARVEDGLVVEVAEKNPISDLASVGIYYFSKGSDYVKYAKQMISKDIRVNNEFYICPIYNEYIQDGAKIVTHHVDKIHGLGTPEDLEAYLRLHPQD